MSYEAPAVRALGSVAEITLQVTKTTLPLGSVRATVPNGVSTSSLD